MEKNLYLDFKPQDEMSDTLSTSAASINHLPYEENSPTAALSVNSPDTELSQGSKKIRKKRNAYGKIDDDTRLKLLEAVQRGETLKSAAKRYQVNYSSAKSIFHIFRKEGRILKKATTEKGFGFDFPGQPEAEAQMQQQQQQFNNMNMNNNMNNNINLNLNRFGQQGFQNVGFQPVMQNQERMFQNLQENSGAGSPLNGLVNNFADLLRIGNQMGGQNNVPAPTPEDILRNKTPHMAIHPSRFNPVASTSPTHGMLKMQPNQQMPQTFGQMSQLQLGQINQMNQMNQINLQRNQLNNQLNQMSQQMAQITLASKPTSNMVSPSERMKQFDNFYMNYNNSPLSGNSRMIREGSESGSNRNLQKEFDSFSDMVTAFQSQNHLTESLKKNEAAALSKFQQNTPTVQQQQQMGGEKAEEENWNGTLENAALDTFKSFIDAQMVLNSAFKKASLLNNLVQIQKSKTDGSPSSRFLSFQGNQ